MSDDNLLSLQEELEKIARKLTETFFSDVDVMDSVVILRRNEGDYTLSISGCSILINGVPVPLNQIEYKFRLATMGELR